MSIGIIATEVKQTAPDGDGGGFLLSMVYGTESSEFDAKMRKAVPEILRMELPELTIKSITYPRGQDGTRFSAALRLPMGVTHGTPRGIGLSTKLLNTLEKFSAGNFDRILTRPEPHGALPAYPLAR